MENIKDKLYLAGAVVVLIVILCALAFGVMVIWNVTAGLFLPNMNYAFSFVLTLVAVIAGLWYWLKDYDPEEEEPYVSDLQHYSYPDYEDEPEESYNEVIPEEPELPKEPEVVEKPKRKTTRRKKVNKEKETE